jgi:hypothetical protein
MGSVYKVLALTSKGKGKGKGQGAAADPAGGEAVPLPGFPS